MPQLLTNDCYLLMACVILSVLSFGSCRWTTGWSCQFQSGLDQCIFCETLTKHWQLTVLHCQFLELSQDCLVVWCRCVSISVPQLVHRPSSLC